MDPEFVHRVAELEAAAGWSFASRELVCRALTHSSYTHELDPEVPALKDNEQLEFLGDAILGFVVSEQLVSRFPAYREGPLSKLKAHLVSATHLHEVARELQLGRYLRLGRGEEMSGGRSKRTILVNGLEALIAAIYLDGGLAAASEFITTRILGKEPERLLALEDTLNKDGLDFKSALQELAQARKLPQPRYVLIGQKGPEHAKTFLVEVRLGSELRSQAEGQTKKSAAQLAARHLHDLLRKEMP